MERIVKLDCSIETLSVCRYYDFLHDFGKSPVNAQYKNKHEKIFTNLSGNLITNGHLFNIPLKMKGNSLSTLDEYIGYSNSEKRFSIQKIVDKIFSTFLTFTNAYKTKVKFIILYVIMFTYHKNYEYNEIATNKNKGKKFFMINQDLQNGALQQFKNRLSLCSDNLNTCNLKQNTIHSIFLTSSIADPSYQAPSINHKKSQNINKAGKLIYKVKDINNKPVYDIAVEVSAIQINKNQTIYEPTMFKVIAYTIKDDRSDTFQFETGRKSKMTKKAVMDALLTINNSGVNTKKIQTQVFGYLLQKHMGDFFQAIESKFFNVPIWTGDKHFQRILFVCGSPCIAQTSNNGIELINMNVFNNKQDIVRLVRQYMNNLKNPKENTSWQPLLKKISNLNNNNFKANINNYERTEASQILLATPALLPIYIKNKGFESKPILIISHKLENNKINETEPSAIIFLENPIKELSTIKNPRSIENIRKYLKGMLTSNSKLKASIFINGRQITNSLAALAIEQSKPPQTSTVEQSIIYTDPTFTKGFKRPRIYPITNIANTNSPYKNMKIFNFEENKVYTYNTTSTPNIFREIDYSNKNRFFNSVAKIEEKAQAKAQAQANANAAKAQAQANEKARAMGKTQEQKNARSQRAASRAEAAANANAKAQANAAKAQANAAKAQANAAEARGLKRGSPNYQPFKESKFQRV